MLGEWLWLSLGCTHSADGSFACLGGAVGFVGLWGPSEVFLRTSWPGNDLLGVSSVEEKCCIRSEHTFTAQKTLGLAAEG